MLSLTIVGMVAYAFIKNRKLAGANSSISTVFQQLNFSNFSLRAKIISALVAIVEIACIVCGCFSTNAHAADGADNPLVPDKSEITATVAEDGTFTLDTCKLANESTEKYTIEKFSVSIAQDAKDIIGHDQTNLTINGFGDGKTVFMGQPGNPSEFKPTDLEDLASDASTILTFAIDLPDDVDIETLLDKQVFTISLTPKEVINWIPMQAEIHDGSKIDFYPAFSTKDQIAGYEFATYDGTDYHDIQNITSMSDIYSALRPLIGPQSATLYYHKTSSATQDLKCCTVKDMAWFNVFDEEAALFGLVVYSNEFVAIYQQDKDGKDNGIKTALLESDNFGSNWDKTEGNVIPELVNNVKYIDNKGSTPSENGGFYGCYGGSAGGLLSDSSAQAWGCVCDGIFAYYFDVNSGSWMNYVYGTPSGVVLARAFN